MTQPKIIGELAVVALKARDLPNREIVGKQDPFCVFRLGEVAKKTKTDYRGGQHPLWDDQVNIPVPEGKTKMRVQLFDEDSKREDLISEGEIDITKAITEGEADDWFPLTYRGRSAGQIYLELTFYSANPPPRRQPTRYKNAGRPVSFGGYHPPVPNAGYRPPSQRPLPPAPTESISTPVRMNKPGPPPYIPPPPPGTSQDQQATPHMPPTINPTPSLSSGVPGRYSSGPGRSPSPAGFVAPSSQSSHGYPPRPPMGYGTQRPDSSAAPLLSAPYNPQGVSPRPHSNGQYPHGDVYPPAHPYPPSNGQYGFPGPSSYPPPAQSNIGFPEPQHFNGNYAPRNDVVGTPFAAHQGIYPPVSSGGYPPANTYPPQQGYPPQPGYPPY